ncbi:hypothetical protein NEAUS04_2011 [Nematocida ausubeli]|nr:hypothetical protein NEAUS07_0558 [Nematocida ausubeli]KAI5164183.1 hypothetical protein NEAUS04_2011 [Nematocida ausubeli]
MLILVALIPINTSTFSIYLSILSFLCICLLFPFFLLLMPYCIFILVYIGKIKCIYSPLKQFILRRYKKRNKA